MSEQMNVQKIGAYAWCVILAAAGGALIIGALAGHPGEEPATVFAQGNSRSPIIAADPDDAAGTTRDSAGITPVGSME